MDYGSTRNGNGKWNYSIGNWDLGTGNWASPVAVCYSLPINQCRQAAGKFQQLLVPPVKHYKYLWLSIRRVFDFDFRFDFQCVVKGYINMRTVCTGFLIRHIAQDDVWRLSSTI